MRKRLAAQRPSGQSPKSGEPTVKLNIGRGLRMARLARGLASAGRGRLLLAAPACCFMLLLAEGA